MSSSNGGHRYECHPDQIPAGYPREYERELWIRNGRRVLVRPIVPDDAQALAAAIEHADAETLRRRFLGAPPRVTPAVLTYLTTVDYVRRFALVAGDAATQLPVAIARYDTITVGIADVAVVVDPEWRRAGLATALIELLAEAALDRGIHAFSTVYLAENLPVTALIGHAGGANRRTISQGIAEVVVNLDRQRVDVAGWAAEP